MRFFSCLTALEPSVEMDLVDADRVNDVAGTPTTVEFYLNGLLP